MTVMSPIERAACCSAPWRAITKRLVLPRVVGNIELAGEVLEIGCGAGANAQLLLERYPKAQLTATDIDPAMIISARRRLASHGQRVIVTEADATALPFDDNRFDAVVSLLMLHHVIAWQEALAQIARVLRPGGVFLGYDLAQRLTSGVHHSEQYRHRFLKANALADGLSTAGFNPVEVDVHGLGTVSRFRATMPVDSPQAGPEVQP
ncbi:MAG: class I SAM-dependent methyltransferase [Microthrixaceae bacterium]